MPQSGRRLAIALALAAGGYGLVLFSGWAWSEHTGVVSLESSQDSASPPDSTVIGSSISRADFPSTESKVRDLEDGTASEPAWLHCFELPEPHDCLLENAPWFVRAEDIALVASMYGLRDPRVMDFTLMVLPTVHPTEAASFIDELFVLLGKDTNAQMFIESIARRFQSLKHPWIELVAHSLGPADLYSKDRSPGAIFLASRLIDLNLSLYDHLEQGAFGAYGGTREQIFRSILGCIAYNASIQDLAGSISFLRAVVDSPSGFEDPFTGGIIASYAISPSFRPREEYEDCLAIITTLLSRAAMREQVARQLYSELKYDPPPGIPESEWQKVAVELKSILRY